MTDQDPPRLKSDGGTPDELVRALGALGRDRDTARLARAAERLNATLAASAAPAAGGLSGLGGAKLVLAVVFGIAAAGGLIRYVLLDERSSGAPAADSPMVPGQATTATPAAAGSTEHTPADRRPSAAPPADTHGRRRTDQPAVTSPRTVRASSDGAGSPEPLRRDEAGPAAARLRRPAPSSSGRSSARAPGLPLDMNTDSTAAEGSEVQADPDGVFVPEPVPASDVQGLQGSAAANTEPQPQAPQPAARQPAAARPLSEVALMRQARKLAVQEPGAALRLLDQHARRFPKGLLVPERELLAIEVLRRLERSAEAERRLRRFQARYPESMHRRRLEERGED